MRIALCLSGGLRNFKDTFYSFEHYLLSFHKVDVFFYGLANKEGLETNLIDLKNLYNPITSVINTKKYYDNIFCPYNQSNAFYAFYNVYKCNELKKEYEIKNNFKYDLVIRSRTDYFWFRTINNDEFELAKTNVLIPEDWAFKTVNSYAKSDVFAFGNSELMDKYSSIFNNLKEYVEAIGMFHSESLCGYHLMIKNIPTIENKKCLVFEYPCKRIEKYFYPYKFIKYFDEPNIENENLFLQEISNKRKTF